MPVSLSVDRKLAQLAKEEDGKLMTKSSRRVAPQVGGLSGDQHMACQALIGVLQGTLEALGARQVDGWFSMTINQRWFTIEGILATPSSAEEACVGMLIQQLEGTAHVIAHGLDCREMTVAVSFNSDVTRRT